MFEFHTLTRMLSKIATFSTCNLPLQFSYLTLANRGFEYDARAGSIRCSGCHFVLDDFKSAIEDISYQHNNRSPSCRPSNYENTSFKSGLSILTTQNPESGYFSCVEPNSKPGSQNGTTDYGKGEHKICVNTVSVDEFLSKENNSKLKEVVESIKSRQEKKESLMNVDHSQTNDNNNAAAATDVTDSGNPASNFAVRNEPLITEQTLHQKAKHPAMMYPVERKKTFLNKEEKYRHCNATVDQFVAAGFYYLGPDDNVRCFCCDGGLKNFQADDDPWIEHKRYYPTCIFVQYKESLPIYQRDDAASIRNEGLRRTAGNVSNRVNSSTLSQAPARPLDTREIKARLETPMIQTLLRMGYERDHIRRALERRLTSVGDDFKSVEELLNDILEAEGESAIPKLSANSGSARGTEAKSTSQLSNGGQSYAGSASTFSQNTQSSLSQTNGSANSSNVIRSSTNAGNFDGVDGMVSARPMAAMAGAAVGKGAVLAAESGAASYNMRKPTSGNNSTQLAADDQNAAASPRSVADLYAELKNSTIQDPELIALMKEYEQLTQTRTCKMCLDREIDTVFLPCGHLVSCHTCAPQITHCCICRSLIRGTVRALITDFNSDNKHLTPSAAATP